MTQDEILSMFRTQAQHLEADSSALTTAILNLAQLLADSRGRLSKENFETLVLIGGALYKHGHNQFLGKQDVDDIMRISHGGPNEHHR
ncbi:hypothetical protein [Noviherbaspirillum malthae]|uniref:hypothetical protein n=1 Tax=Noviherbaspirillum malthae TaxID=1260987 RepID=UPI00188DEEC5|nr:hypothetical protein [Noviherbaspirillum malthae]